MVSADIVISIKIIVIYSRLLYCILIQCIWIWIRHGHKILLFILIRFRGGRVIGRSTTLSNFGLQNLYTLNSLNHNHNTIKVIWNYVYFNLHGGILQNIIIFIYNPAIKRKIRYLSVHLSLTPTRWSLTPKHILSSIGNESTFQCSIDYAQKRLYLMR